MAVMKNQNIHKIRSIDDMRKFYARLNEMESDGEKLVLDFNIDNYSEDVCERITDIANKVAARGFKPQIRVCGKNLEFSKTEIERLDFFEDECKKLGYEFYISDEMGLYSVEETMMAYAKARIVEHEIESYEGSPFEKFIKIYQHVTSHVYKENKDNKAASRDIISVLNGDDIVCVGYAKLIERLCKVAGIECKMISCDLFDSENGYITSHKCNLIYLKDEKYGIDGWYHVDACWDAVKNGGEPFLNYTHCLIPIEDVKHFAQRRFDFYDEVAAIYGEEKENFIDYFNKPIKLKNAMEYLGLQFDTKFPVIETREYYEKRDAAISKLSEIMKSKKVPNDVYEVAHGLNGIFKIESLIALCIDADANKDKIDYVIDELKKLYKSSKEKKLKRNQTDINDVYEFLIDMKLSPSEKEEIYNIKSALTIINNYDVLAGYVRGMKESKPINMKRYARAIKSVLMSDGQSEEYSETFTKRAMVRTTKRASVKFDNGAINAFKQKAIALNKEKNS